MVFFLHPRRGTIVKSVAYMLIFSATILSSQPLWAVDLANRLGVGYSNQLAVDVPAITARYYPNSATGFSLAVGINTENQESAFGVLAKIYRIIFTEDNMNFYIGGGAGLSSLEEAGQSNSGFELMGFLGGEFFFSGLENLGFTFEAGVGIRSDSDGTLFRTVGDHPFRGGIIFYF
jgi:hypothetical protein